MRFDLRLPKPTGREMIGPMELRNRIIGGVSGDVTTGGEMPAPVPVPLDGTSTNQQGECRYCGRQFTTRIKLGQHMKADHIIQWNDDINVERVKPRWLAEEGRLMAAEEARILAEASANNIRVMNMNQRLNAKFPERSNDAIKCHRKDPNYRQLVSDASRELIIGEYERAIGNDVTPSEVQEDLEIALRNAITSNIQAFEGNQPHSTRTLIAIAHDVLGGQECGGRLSRWIGQRFPIAVLPKGPRIQKAKEYSGGRRERRRQHYAEVQKMYKKDYGAAARAVLVDTNNARVVHPTTADMFGFWKEVYETPVEGIRTARPAPRSVARLKGIWAPVSELEIKNCELDLNTAAGPDGITVASWRSVHFKIRRLFFNVILLSGGLETELNKARTVFLSKVDGGSTSPGDYRPLSITSVVVRQLHKIMANRFKNLHKFDERQKAFTECDGTMENLSILSAVLADAKTRRKEVHMATLDLRKAFDSVAHETIIETLERIGVPLQFIKYIRRLYTESETVLQFNLVNENIKVARGVLQGDPLSPLLFNAVMDRALNQLSKDVGYTMHGRRFNAVAYADDIILMSQTKRGLQLIIDQLTEVLKSFGLMVNQDKSSTLSLVPSGREKKIKVLTSGGFNADGTPLKQIGILDTWKYLGVQFEGATRANAVFGLRSDLEKMTKAPLKPQQRLYMLKTTVLAKYMHVLVLGRTTRERLHALDVLVRNEVRKWLRLPHDVPTAYFYADVASGGLGLPSLTISVPMIKASRLTTFLESGTGAAAAMEQSHYVKGQLEWCSRQLAVIGDNVNKTMRSNYWQKELESKIDTKDLSASRGSKASSVWVYKSSHKISGQDYVHYHHIRAGCLPSRARTTRGRNADRNCRAGCHRSETNHHVIQQCHRTHGGRIYRHDRIVKMLSDDFGSARESRVLKEPHFNTVEGLRKPDLILIRRDTTYVLDVQIVHGGDMSRDNRMKSDKYKNVAGLSNMIERRCGTSEIIYEAITISYKGIFYKDTANLLRKLGVSQERMFMLSTSILRGTWLNWKRFNSITTMSPGRRIPPR